MLRAWWHSDRANKIKTVVKAAAVTTPLAMAVPVLTGGGDEPNAYAAMGVVVVIVVLIVYLISRVLRYRRLRTEVPREFEQLVEYARERGWEPSTGDRATLPLRGVPFTLPGRHGVLRAMQCTVDGHDVRLLHFRSTMGELRVRGTDRKDTRNYYDFTVLAVGVDADFPVTMAEPRRGIALVKGILGFEEVRTELAEFNAKWRVVGTDPKAAHAIVHPGVFALLTAVEDNKVAVTWDGGIISMVQPGFTADHQAFESDVALLTKVAAQTPDYMALSGPTRQAVQMPTTAPVKVSSSWLEWAMFASVLALPYAGILLAQMLDAEPRGWMLGGFVIGGILAGLSFVVHGRRAQAVRKHRAEVVNRQRVDRATGG